MSIHSLADICTTEEEYRHAESSVCHFIENCKSLNPDDYTLVITNSSVLGGIMRNDKAEYQIKTGRHYPLSSIKMGSNTCDGMRRYEIELDWCSYKSATPSVPTGDDMICVWNRDTKAKVFQITAQGAGLWACVDMKKTTIMIVPEVERFLQTQYGVWALANMQPVDLAFKAYSKFSEVPPGSRITYTTRNGGKKMSQLFLTTRPVNRWSKEYSRFDCIWLAEHDDSRKWDEVCAAKRAAHETLLASTEKATVYLAKGMAVADFPVGSLIEFNEFGKVYTPDGVVYQPRSYGSGRNFGYNFVQVGKVDFGSLDPRDYQIVGMVDNSITEIFGAQHA